MLIKVKDAQTIVDTTAKRNVLREELAYLKDEKRFKQIEATLLYDARKPGESYPDTKNKTFKRRELDDQFARVIRNHFIKQCELKIAEYERTLRSLNAEV